MSGSALMLVPFALLLLSAAVCLLIVRLRRTSGQLLEARRDQQPLVYELPYWTFLDDGDRGVAVNVDLTYSSFFRLRGVDVDCFDDEALARLSEALHGMLQSLPPSVILQFLHWTDGAIADQVAEYVRSTQTSGEFGAHLVARKARALLHNPRLRRSRLVLALSLPRSYKSAGDAALGFTRTFPAFTPLEHAGALGQLRTLASQLERGLGAVGMASQPLPSGEVRALCYQLLNPTRKETVPDPFTPPRSESANPHTRPWVSELSARQQLVYSGVEERRDSLLLDRKLLRILTLKSLPTCTQPALLELLLVGLPSFHCRVQVAVELLDTTQALDDLKVKRDRAHLLATYREKRNQEAEAQEDDVAELIDKNLRSSVRMVQLSLSVVLSVDAGGESDGAEAALVLDKQTAEVIRVVHSLYGAQIAVDDLNQLDEFLATLPGNARRSRRWLRCTSENAAHLLPAWEPWTGAAEPLLLFQNGRNNLVGLDPFDSALDNPNAFMAGASGAGKSSTTNYLLLNLLAAGARAIVVDVGGSYRRVIHLFGGQYFAVKLDGATPSSLNLFFRHSDVVLEDGKLDEQRLAFMLAVVERMVVSRARPELRNVERAVVSRAIRQTYQRVAGRTPILSDLATTLRDQPQDDEEDTEIARSLARSLRVWTDGPAQHLVNRESTIELTSDCAAFDLKGLEAHAELQGVVLLILSGLIWNVVMRDQTSRKIVVFDEVWRLLESPASAQLIAELYRTSRKYRCSILTISQSVEDFTRSPIAPALINNSATVYLLKHQRGHEVVADQFHLNERERRIFEGLELRRGEYTEVLVLHGQHHFLARVVLTPEEYWIATTHPADLALERQLRAREPSLSLNRLITRLADRYPRGAGAPASHPEDLHEQV